MTEHPGNKEIAFSLAPADVTAFYDDWCSYYRRNHLAKRFSLRYLLWNIGWLVAVFGSLLLTVYWTDSFLAGLAAMYTAAYGGRWLIPKWQRLSGLRRLHRYPGFLGNHQASVSAEGLSDCTVHMRWTLFWSQVSDVAVTENNILFVYETGGRPSAFPVPLRVFKDIQQSKQFVEQAGQFWKQAAAISTI